MNARALLVVAALAFLSGCAANAPQYQPTIANVDSAAGLRGSIAVGKFDFRKGEESSLNSVSARGTSFNSPVNNSWADYLAQAATTELKSAGKLDAASPRVLTGTIEQNALSGAGINTNDAEVSVRFKLADGAKTTYEKTVTAKHQWETSFMGAIAIPRALQNYVVTLQKVLSKLYGDPEFVDATGRK